MIIIAIAAVLPLRKVLRVGDICSVALKGQCSQQQNRVRKEILSSHTRVIDRSQSRRLIKRKQLGTALWDRFSSVRIQNEETIRPDLGEVEHLRDRIRDAIERSLANAFSSQPVVLDEANDRSLIGHGMVNRVLQRPR
jgi:hypothetical protein